MKKILIILIAVLPCSMAAQFTLEHTFSEGIVYGHVIEDGEIIYSHSSATGESPEFQVTLTFYNSNFQSIGSSTYFYFSTASFPYGVSRNLVNSDDQIEFFLTTGLIDEYSLQIRTVNGTVIQELEGCNGIGLYNTNQGAIGITGNCNDNSPRVYSFPGTLPSGMAENGNGEVLAFPNPTKSFINIPTEGAAQVEVYNTMGQKVFEMPTNGTPFQQVPTSQLAPGTYIYQTTSEQQVKPGKMFVVE